MWVDVSMVPEGSPVSDDEEDNEEDEESTHTDDEEDVDSVRSTTRHCLRRRSALTVPEEEHIDPHCGGM